MPLAIYHSTVVGTIIHRSTVVCIDVHVLLHNLPLKISAPRDQNYASHDLRNLSTPQQVFRTCRRAVTVSYTSMHGG